MKEFGNYTHTEIFYIDQVEILWTGRIIYLADQNQINTFEILYNWFASPVVKHKLDDVVFYVALYLFEEAS